MVPDVKHIRRRRVDSGSRQVALLSTLVRSAIDCRVISGQLARTLQHWAKLWRVPDLPDHIIFRHNARLRTTIARWVIESNCLEVSTRFFELRRDHREILCHELAHAAALKTHGRAIRPHGSEWRELVRDAGYEPRTRRVSKRGSHAPLRGISPQSLYEHRCPVCHAVRYGKKPVTKWRCVECVGAGLSGNLTIKVVPHGATVP